MTNQRKSYIVSVFVILALAFGAMFISQGVMARGDQKLERAAVVDDDGIQLSAPLPSDGVNLKKATKAPKTPDLLPEFQSPSGQRRTNAAKAAASTEGGGDTYATATLIAAMPYSDIGETETANSDYIAPCGDYDGAPDVVYSYTATATGMLSLSLCNAGTDYDTKIWVVESATLTAVGCNDDACPGYISELNAPVTVGLTYYIVIGGYSPADAGNYEMTADLVIPGTACTVPLEITFPVADSLDGATYTADLSISPIDNGTWLAGYGARAWYWNFTAPVNGQYTFSWCDNGAVAIDPVNSFIVMTLPVCGLGVSDVAPYPPNWGANCAAQGPNVLQTVMVAGTGKEIAIEVFGGEPIAGTLTVSWSPLPLPNDDCADAVDLGAGATGDVFGHNLGATRDGPGIDLCSVADPAEVCADVWYVWEADADGYARFDMCAGETDNKLWVYAGDQCLTANPREALQGGCSDDGCGVGGGPAFGEVPCHAGDRFLVRIAGWYIEGDPTYGDCNAYGMGVFYINCEVFPTSIRPYNDNCVALTPTLLSNRVLLQIPNQTTDWAGWDCLPTLNSIIYEQNTWHAVTLPFCADTLEVNFCGTIDGGRSTFIAPYNFAPIMTGCPCSGAYVTLFASRSIMSTARCQDYGFDLTHDGNASWQYLQMIPGDYYFPVSRTAYRGNAAFGLFIDYQINFIATQAPCAYCAATANVNSCPPVAGSTWIDRVSISNLVNPPTGNPGSGCHGLQDFTAMTAKVYRGFQYTLTARYGRQGGGALVPGDSCDVWVDWNQNSGLCANQTETFERTRLTRIGPDVTCTLNVPIDAALPGEGATGSTLMRLRLANAADGSNAACGSKTWGEVEDYTLIVANLECGDFNIDGSLNADDIAFLRAYYFGTGSAPDYWQRGDIDGDGYITIADIIALADAAYRGGALNCM